MNGKTSSYFHISNGTRLGCHLSPLIFVLTLEPFLQTIIQNMDITGLKVSKAPEQKVDILFFYLTKPRISLPNLMNELREFGKLSNFQVNTQ